MARLAGVNLPNKKLIVALTYLYGIGKTTATRIVQQLDLDPTRRIDDLPNDDLIKIRNVLEGEYTIEGDLRRKVAMNIKRLIDIGSYRGTRHRKNLPVRGQRTRSNSRTRKGPAKSIGGLKKKQV